MTTDDYSLQELMVIEAGRRLGDTESVVVGLGLPVLAATIAKLTSHPHFVYSTEIGVFDWYPDPETIARGPVGIHDISLFPGSGMLSDMTDALGAWTHGGGRRLRLPHRRPDRQVRQHQYHRHRRLHQPRTTTWRHRRQH